MILSNTFRIKHIIECDILSNHIAVLTLFTIWVCWYWFWNQIMSIKSVINLYYEIITSTTKLWCLIGYNIHLIFFKCLSDFVLLSIDSNRLCITILQGFPTFFLLHGCGLGKTISKNIFSRVGSHFIRAKINRLFKGDQVCLQFQKVQMISKRYDDFQK